MARGRRIRKEPNRESGSKEAVADSFKGETQVGKARGTFPLETDSKEAGAGPLRGNRRLVRKEPDRESGRKVAGADLLKGRRRLIRPVGPFYSNLAVRRLLPTGSR